MNFKDEKNRWRTKSIFIEHKKKNWEVYYTLKDENYTVDGVEYPSLYKLFMQSADMYDFAVTYLGGLPHLEALRKSSWFEFGIGSHRGFAQWLVDMDMRDKSTAKKALLQAQLEGKVQASTKLFDAATKQPQAKKQSLTIRPKPSKKENKDDDAFLDDVSSRLNVIKFRD